MNLNNKIGLGSVQFGIPYGISNKFGQTNSNEVTNILKHAEKSDIKIIDTAAAYGNAEEILGQNDLENFKIISKFICQNKNDSITIQLNKSLNNLKIESLYGYLAHRPLSLVDNPKHWDELLRLKEQNKIKKIGFSLNEPKEIELLLQKGMIPDLIQVPYNYFDNRFKEVMIELKNKGCEIHTRSTFLQGIFFSDLQKLPSYFDSIKNKIKELQFNFESNLSGSLLKYVLSSNFIDVVIMGIENREQLKMNLSSIDNAKSLPEEKFNFSNSILTPSNWPIK